MYNNILYLFSGNILKFSKNSFLPFCVLAVLSLMVIPLPPIVLDLFFTSNIMISLVVLMVAVKVYRPLDFSSFPTVLLFATLLRLSLNVASTRVVLVQGHTGTGAAGNVIEAFGEFLVAGNYTVGLLVFAILVIINLVVITKGAGRVSEVSARFTLDAMPGKQMAIDADMNAGLLTPDEARTRRREVAIESDFYGSMDGASKFVKGDAIASLLILLINVIGGLIVGTVQHDLGLSEAAEIYVLLSIGDGLVAQVPSLLLSIATAIVVTRVSSDMDLPDQVATQVGLSGVWLPVAGILGLLGIIPGMPNLLFLGGAAFAGVVAFWFWRKGSSESQTNIEDNEMLEAPGSVDSIEWEEVTEDVAISLEIGYGLISLVDDAKRAPLTKRITGIRRQLSKEFGFIVPTVRIRDNIQLNANAYQIVIGGVVMADDIVHVDKELALDSPMVKEPMGGESVKDPTFGLDAVWISPDDREKAVSGGYTVVDASTVVATHLNQIIIQSIYKLFGQDEAKILMDTLAEKNPELINNLVPKVLPLQTVTQVLQNLLEEQVPIRELRQIIGAVSAASAKAKDHLELTELVRPALGGLLVQRLCGVKESLRVVTFEGPLEQLLIESAKAGGDNSVFPIEPALAQRVVDSLREIYQEESEAGTKFAVVTSPMIRRQVYQLVKQQLPDLTVLSFYEIPDSKQVQVISVIGDTKTEN